MGLRAIGKEIERRGLKVKDYVNWPKMDNKKISSAIGNIGGKFTKGNFNDWKNALGMRESSDNYKAHRPNSQFLGRYQIGTSALQDIGFKDKNKNWTDKAKELGVISNDSFLNTPKAQDIALELLVKKQLSYIKHYALDKYIGQTMNDIKITESGLVGAAHLVGAAGVKKALESGDFESVGDAFNTKAKEYMELMGGYNLHE